MPTTILLVDDHPVFRKGLLFLLEEEDDMTVVGEAGDGQAAIDRVRELSPDVVIMDITMPNLDGIEATRHILSEFPDAKIIALSIHSGKRFVEDMLHAGAVGYLLKESVPEELVKAIRMAARGDIYLNPAITAVVVEGYREAVDRIDNRETDFVPILRTKLHRPPITEDILTRTHLINRLQKNRKKPLTLVSAPAGYGKSILISSWIEEVKCLHTWMSLDKEHNDLRIFLAYFVAAVNRIFPEKLQTTEFSLKASNLPPLSIIAENIVNELDQIDDDFVMVMDDFHLINNEQIFELFNVLIQHPPQNMHLVIITRRDPSLNLNELRTYARMNEIRMAALSFNRGQTKRLFKKLHGIELSDTISEQLLDRTEGWIVGIRLASLGIETQEDAEHILGQHKGDVRLISEFLLEEVLGKQPAEIQNYLLVSSILNRFCPELLESLTDNKPEKEEHGIAGKEFLEWLVKTNLFVIPLDEEYKWFRYHHLFQQLLGDQLEKKHSPNDIAVLHSQASKWFVENGLIDEAITHAIAAGDMEVATGILAQNRHVSLDNDQWYVLEKWLTMFPETVVQQQPELLLAKAWILYERFQFADILPVVETVESLLKDKPKEPARYGEVEFFRGYCSYFLNERSRSLKHLQDAIKNIPLTYDEVRGQAEILYGLACQIKGQKDVAVEFLNELLDQLPSPQKFRKTRLLTGLVFIHIIAGDLSEAFRVNQRNQDVATKSKYLYAEAWSMYLKGLIHFYRNEMNEAIHYFSQAIEQRYVLHIRASVDAMAGLSLAYQLVEQPDRASDMMDLISGYIMHLNDPDYLNLVKSSQARLSIMQGKPEPASAWIQGPPPPVENMIWWLEIPSVTHCRALLAEGSDESLKKAVIKLQDFLKLNEQNHNTCHKIQIMALLALVYKKQKQTDEALKILREALNLAKPGRWIFPFIELGSPMADLLKQLPKKNAAVDFVQELLAAFTRLPLSPSVLPSSPSPQVPHSALSPSPLVSQSPSPPLSPSALSPRPPLPQPLIEPLTNRELEILELLEKRQQNKEIAEKLFISPETVKVHLRNIFQKLGAGNRREAVETAKQLKII